METVSNYVNYKIKELGISILQNIAVNPCEQNGNNACTYCAYKSVCGYDKGIDGYELRELEKLPQEEVLKAMQEAMDS